MNFYFIVAAILIIITGIIHSILGEKLIISPTLKLKLPQILGSDFLTKQTLRFAWHLTTLIWWANAVILILFSNQPLNPSIVIVAHVLSIAFFLSGLVSLIVAYGKHFSWYVFLIVAILIFFGAR